MPLQISEAGIPSQFVPVSIHTGAGACVDPPQQSSGQITLQRTIFANSTQPETDALTATFSAFPASTGSSPVAPPAPACYIGDTVYHPPPNSPCGIPGIQPLSVGGLTVQAAGFAPLQAVTTINNGSLVYTAAMPSASIQQGNYTVNVMGAGSVGPFQTAITAGPPIQITSQFAAGDSLTASQLEINWTGGDDSEIVVMRLVDPGQIFDGQLVCAALGSAQSVRYALYLPGQFGQNVLYYPQGSDLEIIVDVVPASVAASLTVPGLTNGVSQTWIYEYRFTGLQVYQIN